MPSSSQRCIGLQREGHAACVANPMVACMSPQPRRWIPRTCRRLSRHLLQRVRCRPMRWLGITLILACSSSSTPAPSPTTPAAPIAAAVCADTQLGGYAGSPECKLTAETPIPGADRACRSNADCIRLGPHCAAFALRADRTDAYSSTPCTDPNSGQCPPPCAAVCREGCCVIPPGWGDNCR